VAKWCLPVSQGSTSLFLLLQVPSWECHSPGPLLGHCGGPSFTLFLDFALKWKLVLVYSGVSFNIWFPRIISYSPDS
jgi:hypothetical protein